MALVLSRLATAKALSPVTYTLLFTGTAAHLYTVYLYVCPSLYVSTYGVQDSAVPTASIYVATNSWSSSEPSGATLIDLIAKQAIVQAPSLFGPFTVNGTEKVVIYGGSDSSMNDVSDWSLYGTDYS